MERTRDKRAPLNKTLGRVKPIAIFGFGAASGVAGALAILFGIAYYGSMEKERLEKQFREVSCGQTADEAKLFAKERLPSIIQAARNNEPNAGPAHIAIWTQVAMLKDKLGACRRVEGNARGTTVPLATYLKPHYDLFSQLDPFMRLWQMQAPKDMSRSEELLNRFEHLQRDLTAGS